MAKDNAPVPHTCSMIDEVISAIDSVEWSETYWTKKDLIETMEKIRKSNETLRNWGNGLHQDLLDLEKNSREEYDALEIVNDNLKWDIKHLESEVEDLKNEIEQFT